MELYCPALGFLFILKSGFHVFVYLVVSGVNSSTWDLHCIMQDLSLQHTDSLGAHGLSKCRLSGLCLCAWALECVGLVVTAHRLSCSVACGILVSGPGITLMFSALQGRFFTIGPSVMVSISFFF